jgi:NACalpha-BTF3-like transcription factor
MKRGAKKMAASSPVECPAVTAAATMTTTDAGLSLAVTHLNKSGEEEAKESKDAVATKPEGEVDASGLEKDIELLMLHTSSRSKAVAALIKTNGDVVRAIMELHM